MGYVGERAWKPWDTLKRSTCKNWFFGKISASLHSHSMPVTKIKTSCCQNKTGSMGREVLGQSWSPACQWQGAPVSMARTSPESYTESCAGQAQKWEPASPSCMSTALKTDSEFCNLTFSCSAPLWAGKDGGLEEIQWRLFLDEKCKSMSDQCPLKPILSSSGTN